MSGGVPSEARPADEEIQTLINPFRGQCEEKSGRQYEQFTAVEYKSQVVAGANYFVKVQVSDSEYVHVSVFQPLSGQPTLSGQQDSKTKEDPIEYF